MTSRDSWQLMLPRALRQTAQQRDLAQDQCWRESSVSKETKVPLGRSGPIRECEGARGTPYRGRATKQMMVSKARYAHGLKALPWP